MYLRDSATIVFAMVATLVVLAVVLREVLVLTADRRVRLVVGLSAAAVGIFATGALTTLLFHLRRNRESLYRADMAPPPDPSG